MRKLFLIILFIIIITNISNAQITGKSMICDNIGYLSTDCLHTEILPMEYKDKMVATAKAKASTKEEVTNNYITYTVKESKKEGKIIVKSWLVKD